MAEQRTQRNEALAELRAKAAESVADFRRREILEAACHLFADRGYQGTTVADIAGYLGIGHGTFYRYFKNKRAVLDQIIDDLTGELYTALGRENAPSAASFAEYRAQLERIMATLWELYDADPPALRMVVRHAGGIDRVSSERIEGFKAACTGLMDAYLENGREQGFLRADLDTQVLSQVLVGQILGVVLVTSSHDKESRKRVTHAGLALFFEGVTASTRKPRVP